MTSGSVPGVAPRVKPSDATGDTPQLPATRLGRTARIGGLAASQTVRYAGVRAANVTRSRHERKIAIERRHLQAADQILAVLGTMKGPAMKLGQLLSFVDLGLLPEDVRPRFQQRLARLCDAAPQIPFAAMEPVLAKAFGAPLDSVFASFERTPVGIASIGQVYRATLHDGRTVAVKVQYPKIVTAARADLKNMQILLRLAKSIAPSVDMQSLGDELTARLTEELDYVAEARHHRELADAFAGHPFLVVPQPVDELCGRRVVVTEFVDGLDFEQLCAQPQGVRDRAGEMLVRFYFGSMFRLGRFSGDPHPGNLKLLADGRMAFFDFGSYKVLDDAMLELMLGTLRAVCEGRGADVVALLARERVLARPESVGPDEALAYFHDVFGWFLSDAELAMTPRVASEAVLQSLAPRSDYGMEMRGQDLPVEWALLVRTVLSGMALLGQLGAQANWHRVAREWIYGDEPASELGQREASFFGR